MTEVVRFHLDDGSTVLFESADDVSGVGRVSRGPDGVTEATSRFEEALEGVRHTASASMRVLKVLQPETIELEFGVKLTAEAGALIAKTAGEGHFQVKLSWEREPAVKTPDDTPSPA